MTYALRFRLGSIPVEIQPGFLVLAFLLGLMGEQFHRGLGLWAALLLGPTALLTHELGHAVVARVFGYPAAVILGWTGSLTRWLGHRGVPRHRLAAIIVAGPASGLLLAAILIGARWWLRIRGGLPELADAALLWGAAMNGVWSGVNLLPVLPLDGGQLLAVGLGPTRVTATAYISGGVGLGLGAFSALRDPLLGFLIAVLAVTGAHRFRTQLAAPPPPDEEARDELLARAWTAFHEGAFPVAGAAAATLLQMETEPLRRAAVLELLGWVASHYEDALRGRAILDLFPAVQGPSPALLALILELEGRRQDALQVLRKTPLPELSSTVRARWVRWELETGTTDQALRVCASLVGEVPSDELRRVAQMGSEQGLREEAAALLWGLFRREGAKEDADRALDWSSEEQRAARQQELDLQSRAT